MNTHLPAPCVPEDEDAPFYDIAPRSRVIVGEIEYIYEQRVGAGYKLARADNVRLCEIFTRSHMHHLIQTEKVRIDEGYFTAPKAEFRLRAGPKAFSDLTEEQVEKVLFKEDWCKRFLKLEHQDRRVRRSEAKMQLAIGQIANEISEEKRKSLTYKKRRGGTKLPAVQKEPTPSQLRRWLKRFERSGYERDALIDQYNGPGTIRLSLDADSYALHHEYVVKYATRDQPKKSVLFLELQEALDAADEERAKAGKDPLKRVKRRAFEKMIDRLDPFFVDFGREGREVALRKWGIVTTGLDVEKPLERLEMDEWKVSLMTIMVHAGVWKMLTKPQRRAVQRARLWLSVAIDARTRMIVAMRLLDSAPSIESALATIELAMMDKSRIVEHVGASPTYLHAKPRSIAMDNGSNYTADAVLERLVLLGISPVHPPAGLAEMRARVERVFLTLRTMILSKFSGQTFANILEKGTYKPEENASLNVEELNRVFLTGVLDLYHNHPHEGLMGETPYDCMRRLSGIYGLPLPPTRDVLRHVMGISCERRIGDEGVRFLGIRYQSKALQLLRREVRQRPVEVRVDRFDLSSISVRKGGGWITVRARYQGLAGVNVWQWAEAFRDLRQRNADMAALSRPVVLGAVKQLSEVGAAAVKRAEIECPVLTAEAFQRLEETLFRGLTFADDGTWGEDLVLPADEAAQSTSTAHVASPQHIERPDLRSRQTDNGSDDNDFENDDRGFGFGSADEWSSD